MNRTRTIAGTWTKGAADAPGQRSQLGRDGLALGTVDDFDKLTALKNEEQLGVSLEESGIQLLRH